MRRKRLLLLPVLVLMGRGLTLCANPGDANAIMRGWLDYEKKRQAQ